MGKKKELGVDRMGVQKSMRKIDYFGDGLGQIPLNIMSGLVGQLTYFYTEKVGLAAGMIGTMLLIAKLFDAVTDLIMGKIMDAGHSPKGKCRPWFLRMADPDAGHDRDDVHGSEKCRIRLSDGICTCDEYLAFRSRLHCDRDPVRRVDGCAYREFRRTW